MDIVENSREEGVEEEKPLVSLDLPRRIRRRLTECGEASKNGQIRDIKYLWVHVTDGVHEGCSKGKQTALSLEEWLNVIDEASSVGVSWLVLSVGTALSDFPGVWEVCEWAQNVHGMTVGIHCAKTSLTDENIEAIQRLNGEKTRLLVRKQDLESLRHLESLGIRLREADPRPGEQSAPCEKPTGMVFVNPQGRLYTCGLVEGNDDYLLGNVFNGTLDTILHNDALPHAVSEQIPREGHGCDGCPPIMAQFFESMDGGEVPS